MVRKTNPDELDPFDRIIYQTLHNSRVPLTAGRIAKYNKIQWETAEKHLEKMYRLGLVIITRTEKIKNNRERKYWGVSSTVDESFLRGMSSILI